MKITGTILLVLVLQASASFFDEFRGSISSVEKSFGRLITDVVTDVKEAIDCTILAVEKALSLGGIFYGPSEYEKKCKGGNSNTTRNPTTDKILESNYLPSPRFELKTSKDIAKGKEDFKKDLFEHIDTSISKINDTVLNAFEKEVNNTKSKLENVKSVLKNETSRLTEVSTLLQGELDKISKDVEKKIDVYENKETKASVEGIWKELKVLHQVEKSNEDSPEAKEISQVFNKVLDVLQIDKNVSTEKDDDKIRDIIKDLGKESNETLSEIESDIFQLSGDKFKENKDEQKDTYENNFKDVNSDNKVSTTEKPNSAEETENESPAYPWFNVVEKGSKAHEEAIQDAKRIFDQNQYTDDLLHDIFSNSGAASSVFDNPELLDFGRK